MRWIAVLALVCGCEEPSQFGSVRPGQPGVRLRLSIHTDGFEHPPSFAAWAGGRTMYATEKAARNSWSGASSRPEALPIWNGLREAEMKSGVGAPVDAVTSASPTGAQFTIDWEVPEDRRDQPLMICVEGNHSFDYNPSYSSSNSGDNGQPSLVWCGQVSFGGETSAFGIMGHGAVLGEDHDLKDDMSGVTTARYTFDALWASYSIR